MKKTFLLILSALLCASAFAHDELTLHYTKWSVMLKGGIARNGYAEFSDHAITTTKDKVWTGIYGLEIERTFNHTWGLAASANLYDFYHSTDTYIPGKYNLFISGQAIETALLGTLNLSNLFSEDRSEGWRRFNIYARIGAGLTFYKTDQNPVVAAMNDNPGAGKTDRNANYDKDYEQTTIVIPTEIQFEYNLSKPLALGLIVGNRWHTSTHFGTPDIQKTNSDGSTYSVPAIGKNVNFYTAQLSLRYKFLSTGENKHIRNYVPELIEEPMLVKAYDDAPILERLDSLEAKAHVHPIVPVVPVEPVAPKFDFKDQKFIFIPVVEFDVDRYTIRNNSSKDLDELAEALADEDNTMNIFVTGHTDSTGSVAHNKTLSQNRANAVKEYLRTKGVKQPIYAAGEGSNMPIDTNATPEGRQRNRRVEIRFATK